MGADLEVFKQITSHAEQTAQILEKKIEWSKYKDSNHIDAEELGLILQYDTHNAEEQADLLNEVRTSTYTTCTARLHVHGVVLYSKAPFTPSFL